MITAQIMDGSGLRSEPSTLEANIMDGSGIQPNNSAHGSNSRQASGAFPEPGAVLPVCSRRRCFIPAAVPSLTMAENTSQNHTVNYMSQNLAVGIADDSVSKIEPSMLKQDIVDGSPRIKGHSTVETHITEEKIFRTWTFYNCGRKSWKVQGYRHRIQ